MADNPFEIPQALRDVTEQNIKQAHTAYEQLTDFVTKAVGAWMGAMPASPMVARLQGSPRPCCGNREEECRLRFRAGRKDRQGTEFSRNFDASDAVCSRPDEGVHHANAGALQADRGGFPEAATRLIFLSTRTTAKKKPRTHVRWLERSSRLLKKVFRVAQTRSESEVNID